MSTLTACDGCGATADLGAGGLCAHCAGSGLTPVGRVEHDLDTLAVVSRPGPGHVHNEDAFFISVAEGLGAVAVVCDGVGSSSAAREAAAAAARTAGRILARGIRGGAAITAELSLGAVEEARTAVAAVTSGAPDPAPLPACTLVSLVWAAGELTVAWVGDSRAYWIGDDSARRLTVDDAVTRAGRGRPLTRWLGADAPAGPAGLETYRPTRHGRVVVCSDVEPPELAPPPQAASINGRTTEQQAIRIHEPETVLSVCDPIE